MQRLYLRLIFSRLEKTLYFFKDFKTLVYNLIKPAVYKKKMIKVLELNRKKLLKKQDIINSKNGHKNAKFMNVTR